MVATNNDKDKACEGDTMINEKNMQASGTAMKVNECYMEAVGSESNDLVETENFDNNAEERGKYDCEKCKRKCRDSEALRRHMKVHRDEEIMCTFCKVTFNGSHQMLSHKKDCYFKCDECPKQSDLERRSTCKVGSLVTLNCTYDVNNEIVTGDVTPANEDEN
jgi:hypothetical protein